MKKTILFTTCFLTLLMVLISCDFAKSKVNIEIDFSKEQNGLLVFDQKDSIKLVGDSTIVYKIAAGKHSFVLNKQKPQSITISSKGGLLNLNKNRFVRISEEYQDVKLSEAQKMMNLKMKGFFNNNIVVIDSLVYIFKRDSTLVVSDEQIKTSLKNYENDHNNSDGFRLYNADLFIEKSWDYGLTEDLPETIEIRSNNSFGNIMPTMKTKLLDENLFRFMVLFSSDSFIVKSKEEIMNNVEDKKVDEDKKKNQLDF